MARGRKDLTAAIPDAGCVGEEAGADRPDDLIISETLVPVDVDLPEDPPDPPPALFPRNRPRYKHSGRDRRVCENMRSIRPADEIDVGLAGGRASTCPR